LCQAISVCDEFCSTLSAQGAAILSHAVKHDQSDPRLARYLGTSGPGPNDWLLLLLIAEKPKPENSIGK